LVGVEIVQGTSGGLKWVVAGRPCGGREKELGQIAALPDAYQKGWLLSQGKKETTERDQR